MKCLEAKKKHYNITKLFETIFLLNPKVNQHLLAKQNEKKHEKKNQFNSVYNLNRSRIYNLNRENMAY